MKKWSRAKNIELIKRLNPRWEDLESASIWGGTGVRVVQVRVVQFSPRTSAERRFLPPARLGFKRGTVVRQVNRHQDDETTQPNQKRSARRVLLL
jgi:hypothetical protein